MNNKELFVSLNLLEQERGIPVDYMLTQIRKAIVNACKNTYNGNENVEIDFDAEKTQFKVKLIKTVVEEVENSGFEISVEDAKQYSKRAVVGSEVKIPLDPKEFGRIAIQTARSIIRQGIRASEKNQNIQSYQDKVGELIVVRVERIDNRTGVISVKYGRAETILLPNEQCALKDVKEGDLIKVYVIGMMETKKSTNAVISRTHPNFVRRMLEDEIPEVYDGSIIVKGVAREAGSKSKVAVLSTRPELDAVGTCIGTKSSRISKIVEELQGEKIEIIQYSSVIEDYIKAALAPADVISVKLMDKENKVCRAIVPDSQLSLAIGVKGQNVRLAAKLVGWRIDLHPESGFYGEEETDDTDTVNGEVAENNEVIENTENMENADIARDTEE